MLIISINGYSPEIKFFNKGRKLFSYLFFLILNLLLFAIAEDQTAWPIAKEQPIFAFMIGLGCYFLFLIFLYYQNKKLSLKNLSRETILFISNIEILVFFSMEYFVVGAGRLLIFKFDPFGQTFALIYFLFLYFTAIHICQKPLKKNDDSLNLPKFLLPFALPFLTLTFLLEMQSFLQPLLGVENNESNFSWSQVLIWGINIFIFSLAIIFFPPIAVCFWGCPKLKDRPESLELVHQLNELCKDANFKGADFRIWSVMKNACTAAIIGVIKPFRYILFTEQLLKELSPKAVVAVLAHEIGHHKKRHLLIYPLVFIGMAAIGTFTIVIIETVLFSDDAFGEFFKVPLSGNLQAIMQVIFFLGFILSVAFYFRFVFGYFSRIFEREADLYVLELNIPASDMIEALDTLGTVYGNIHDKPNWHHYSIAERIDCLKKAEADPQVILKHHKLVKFSIVFYVLCLILLLYYLFV